MSFENQTFDEMSNERSYLLENLRRQHDRGQRLTHALYNVETRLASAQSKGAARKLRKEAGLLRSKIAESNKQETLVTNRLNDLQGEDSNRLYQVGQLELLPYPYAPIQPWGHATLSPLTPLTPTSPLTPLPPGIYHPVPIAPSPLESSFLLTSPFWLYSPVVSYQQVLPPEGEHQGLYVQAQHDAATLVKAEETRRKSVEYRAARAFDSISPGQENTGRRWSMADTFSPSPRDKRMSMPGLQTIWRY